MSRLAGTYARHIAPCAFVVGCLASPRAAAADPPSASRSKGPQHSPGACAPRPPPEQCIYGGDHKPHTRNLLGAKALVVTSLATSGTATDGRSGGHSAGPSSGLGVIVFYERELVPKWLEIELNVGLVDGHQLQMPIDLLLKKPFHLSRRVTPYIGIGPSVELFPRGERAPILGITGGLGLYLWLSRDFGLDVEIDYTLHRLAPGLEHVNTFGVGPVIHF